jgi:hypothetical protein
MNAHMDFNSGNPFEIAARAYSKGFLRELGERYGFDGTGPEMPATLRDIAARYILRRRLDNLPDMRREQANAYRDLQQNVSDFFDALKS